MTYSSTMQAAVLARVVTWPILRKPAEQPSGSDEGAAVLKRFIRESAAVAQIEVVKLLRDPTVAISRAFQPILWLVIFGQVMAGARGFYAGELGYLAFITPGILGAECVVQRDILRHCDYLGARPGYCAQAAREPGTA
jgi:hypothetical protein